MDEQSLNELLECSVCLERLDHTSKVLPCQHTFCRRCLDEIVSTKRELRCPECRTLVEIRVEELPSNILLIRLLEGLKTKNNDRLRPAERRNEHLSLSAVQHLRQGLSRLNQPCAKALFNYEARDHGDLSFKKGDVIILRKQVDENWYHGECDGQHGFFPASYAQVIIPLPVTIPQCKALYDFDFEKESEKKDCLCFKKDELITVIKRVDDNWVEGRKGEKIGIFPISFVEMNEAAKTLINVNSNPALHAGNRGNGEGAPAGPSSDLLNPAVLAGQLSHQKRHSYTGSSQQQNSVTKQHNRRSLDLNSKTNLEILQMPVTNSDRVRSPPPVPNHSKDRSGVTTSVIHQPRKETGNDVSLESNSQNSSRTLQCMVAMFNYKPQKDDEVELRKGDHYSVTETCLDGWFRGKCVKTGKIGVFPGNYVQPARSPSAFRAVGGNIQNIRAKLPPSQPVHGGPTPLSTGPDLSRSKKSSSPVRQRSSSARPSGSPSRASSSPSRSSSSPQRSSTVPPSVTPRVSKTHLNTKSSSSSHPTSSVSATASSSSTSSSMKMTHAEAHSHDRQPLTSATTYLSSSSRHHHNHSSMSVVQHSMSTSANTTPPNVVLGATAEKSAIPAVKDREKKEKNQKEKISLVKRLVTSGKSKKSKSPATEAEGASSSSDFGVTHFRSGSFPTDVISVPEGQHAKSSSFDSSVPPPAKTGKSKHFVREKFRCKEPYPPQSEIELELKVGDIVYVHKKREDGWYKGTLQRTGKSGLFPGSFVEKID